MPLPAACRLLQGPVANWGFVIAVRRMAPSPLLGWGSWAWFPFPVWAGMAWLVPLPAGHALLPRPAWKAQQCGTGCRCMAWPGMAWPGMHA